MNPRLVETQLKSVLSGVGATVVQAYDQTHDIAAAQVVVSATCEATTRNIWGKPVDFAAQCQIIVGTHSQEDQSGATRRGVIASILSWFDDLTLSTMSVTGYTCVSASDLNVGEATPAGEEFVSETVTVTLQYMGA